MDLPMRMAVMLLAISLSIVGVGCEEATAPGRDLGGVWFGRNVPGPNWMAGSAVMLTTPEGELRGFGLPGFEGPLAALGDADGGPGRLPAVSYHYVVRAAHRVEPPDAAMLETLADIIVGDFAGVATRLEAGLVGEVSIYMSLEAPIEEAGTPEAVMPILPVSVLICNGAGAGDLSCGFDGGIVVGSELAVVTSEVGEGGERSPVEAFAAGYQRALYDAASEPALLDGIWLSTTGPAQFEIDTEGRISGYDMSACEYAGQLASPHPDRNLYEMVIEVSRCGDFDGSYAGLATLIEGDAPGEAALLFQVDDGDYLLSDLLMRD